MGAAVDVDGTVLGAMVEGGASDLVPHLAGDHSETEEERGASPHLLVLQELEVIPPKVEEASGQDEQGREGDRTRIVGRTEHTNLEVV